MFVVRDEIVVNAPIERCFLLSTSIELVQRTLGLRPVAAESRKVTGLIEAGDQLVWRGWKFGLPQMHETLITAYEPPHFFQDTMGRGRFAGFRHDHRFTVVTGADGGHATLFNDAVRFTMRFGWVGARVARLVMVPQCAGWYGGASAC